MLAKFQLLKLVVRVSSLFIGYFAGDIFIALFLYAISSCNVQLLQIRKAVLLVGGDSKEMIVMLLKYFALPVFLTVILYACREYFEGFNFLVISFLFVLINTFFVCKVLK